jgi:hypothetical protein
VGIRSFDFANGLFLAISEQGEAREVEKAWEMEEVDELEGQGNGGRFVELLVAFWDKRAG